jgi:hypothetical protein
MHEAGTVLCPEVLPRPRQRPDGYFRAIADYLARHPSRFFRWHVSGDVVDARYWEGMLSLAYGCPQTRFLAFTKRVDILSPDVVDVVPENLSLVISAWPGFDIPQGFAQRFPIAWMRDRRDPDPRIPAGALECPGNCESCGMCWSLARIGRDVVFDKH